MRRIIVALVLCNCLVLAGCASIGSPTPTPTTTATTTTTTTVEDPTTTTPAETTAPNGSLEVHFINVGQSVSTLIVGPTGETMLIDTGDFKDDGEFVLAYLQRHNIERIDYLVTSHNDADHIGGNAAVIEYYETEADGIGAVYDPGIDASTQTYEEYLDAVEEHDVPLYLTLDGDSIPMAGVSIEVLAPPQPYLDGEDRNENSIVLKLTFGETTFLFPGDAEVDQEQYLVAEYGPQLDVDVLKAGHHGSSTSSNGPFLAATDPVVVIISSAYDSRFGHPHEETLQRLADRSIPTYWTGVHGDIVLVSDGDQITIQTQQTAPTEPLSLRSGSPVEPGTTDPVVLRARITDGDLQPVAAESTTTTMADGGTHLAVATVHADAVGDDRENLSDEYVVFENTGSETIDLGGWTIEDAAGHRYTVPDGFTLAPGATVTLHTGSGTDTDTHLYWGAGRPVWNNGGDTIIVKTAGGEVVLEEDY